VLDREREARDREELNGLYVAMTRARTRLVFSATQAHRAAEKPSWWLRIQALARPGAAAPAQAHPDGGAHQKIVFRGLPAWSGVSDQTPPTPRARPADDEASRLGQAVHRTLEWAAARSGPKACDAAEFATLASAAAREFYVDEREVLRLASRIWQSPTCEKFFRGAGLRWSGNEVPVSEGGEALRIDRLVELEANGERAWWVLDYKLLHTPDDRPEYRDQLLRYRRAVQALQPDDKVRCAFITGAGEVVELP
jgi:ATP-dependent helicase/nuclease subunit A